MLLKPYMISRPVFIGFQGQERSSFALRSRLLPTCQLANWLVVRRSLVITKNTTTLISFPVSFC